MSNKASCLSSNAGITKSRRRHCSSRYIAWQMSFRRLGQRPLMTSLTSRSRSTWFGVSTKRRKWEIEASMKIRCHRIRDWRKACIRLGRRMTNFAVSPIRTSRWGSRLSRSKMPMRGRVDRTSVFRNRTRDSFERGTSGSSSLMNRSRGEGMRIIRLC